EEWRYMVAQYHKAAAGAVERFGGHVAQYLGDGLLVYFGWPDAREDDPERAVRAGLAILDAMGSVNARLATPHPTGLAVRVGLRRGEVSRAPGRLLGRRWMGQDNHPARQPDHDALPCPECGSRPTRISGVLAQPYVESARSPRWGWLASSQDGTLTLA